MSETDEKTEPKRAAGAPKNNQNARKSGHYALERSLKRDGFSVLTRRQRETVREWREMIEADAGGCEQLSELKRHQLERYLVTEILIQSIDAYLLTQKSVFHRRKKALYPIVEQRSRLAELSLKLASAIGLERRSREVPDLKTYLAQRERQAPSAPAAEPEETHD